MSKIERIAISISNKFSKEFCFVVVVVTAVFFFLLKANAKRIDKYYIFSHSETIYLFGHTHMVLPRCVCCFFFFVTTFISFLLFVFSSYFFMLRVSYRLLTIEYVTFYINSVFILCFRWLLLLFCKLHLTVWQLDTWFQYKKLCVVG